MADNKVRRDWARQPEAEGIIGEEGRSQRVRKLQRSKMRMPYWDKVPSSVAKRRSSYGLVQMEGLARNKPELPAKHLWFIFSPWICYLAPCGQDRKHPITDYVHDLAQIILHCHITATTQILSVYRARVCWVTVMFAPNTSMNSHTEMSLKVFILVRAPLVTNMEKKENILLCVRLWRTLKYFQFKKKMRQDLTT